MCADAELAGIVGNDDRVANQAMMVDRTPDARFGERTDLLRVEDVDTLVSQIVKERDLIAEVLRCSSSQPGHDGGAGAISLIQIIEGRVVQHVVLIIAAQQAQKVEA